MAGGRVRSSSDGDQRDLCRPHASRAMTRH
jgi:hypothetical protein